jgi:hypothetical protein
MISHPKYSKARLFLPDKPACQVYRFSKPEHQEQEELTVEEQVNELWGRLIDLEFEIMHLLDKTRERQG